MKAKLVGGPPPAAPPPPPAPEPVPKTPTDPGRRPTRIRGKEPTDAAGWVERATELLRAGEARQAVESFTKAIELDATLAKAYAGRGVAYEALGRAEEAKADYKTSIGIELRGVLKSEYGYKEKPE